MGLWDDIINLGPSYGYYTNAKKSWFVVKEAHYTSAPSAFHGTSLNITTTGRPHLGAPLGTQTFVTQYVKDKVDNWVNNLIALSHIATTQPHAAYSAFTYGLIAMLFQQPPEDGARSDIATDGFFWVVNFLMSEFSTPMPTLQLLPHSPQLSSPQLEA